MKLHRLTALLLALLLLAGCAPQTAPAEDPGPVTDPVVTPDPTPATPDPAPVTPDPTPVTPDPTPVTPDPGPDLSSDTTHTILTDDPVLIERRKTVESYMREMGTFVWRCPENLLYTIASNVDPQESSDRI